MIYSYKEVIHLEPPVTTDTFNDSHAYNEMRSALGENITADQEMELRSAICNLGNVEGREYISIPDGMDIGPQNPNCDVRKEGDLDLALKSKLINEGRYSKDQKELASLEYVELKNDLSWAAVKNFANVYTVIRDLNSVLSKLIEASPAVLADPNDASFNAQLETIKKLKSTSDQLNDKLNKLGL